MSSSITLEMNISQDFEVLWIDKDTLQPKDMDDVTMEIYHYTGPSQAQFVTPLSEPYIFTETINDTVNIGSINGSEIIDVHITLDLNIIATQLEGLGCAPNEFTVPNTCHKVSIVNGYKKYALSACELSALINLGASGYTAHADNGQVVITSDFEGEDTYLQIGNGTWNTTVGIVEGTTYHGQGIEKEIVYGPQDMVHIETGLYALTEVVISEPAFQYGERYYVAYKGSNPTSHTDEIQQENFTILSPAETHLNISFIK